MNTLEESILLAILEEDDAKADDLIREMTPKECRTFLSQVQALESRLQERLSQSNS